ncbi:MAG: histidine triad nucleotide-binding protein [Burkholderiales bacterium]|jgi:histidine triad (HIT) family protein|nr:histidine triad nucleotide-binding protein [Burkholderiales bacterium]
MENCIFCKIARGEIPSKKIYQDDDVIAFHDIRPIAPVHFMVVPALHVGSLAEVTEDHRALMGKIMVLASRLAKEQGCTDGFRTIVNTGRVGGQEVQHLHLHVIGGGEPLGPMLARR